MSVVDDNDCNAATRPTDTQVSLLCPAQGLALGTKMLALPHGSATVEVLPYISV